MVLHKDLTGAHLHEPKGVDAASSGKVYVSDGAGSGVWTSLVIPSGTFYVNLSTFTSSGTWTKPANLFLAKVHCIGSGGTQAQAGGSVSFGSYCSASGGSNAAGNTPGTGSGGDINLSGGRTRYTANSGQQAGTGGILSSPWGTLGWGADEPDGTAGNRGGHAGGYAMEWLTSAEFTGVSSVTVTVNTGGNNNGAVIVEEYISI